MFCPSRERVRARRAGRGDGRGQRGTFWIANGGYSSFCFKYKWNLLEQVIFAQGKDLWEIRYWNVANKYKEITAYRRAQGNTKRQQVQLK